MRRLPIALFCTLVSVGLLQGVIGRQEQGDVNLDPTKISKKSGFKLQFWRDRGDWPNELDMERMGNAAQARAKPNVQPATPSS